MQMFYWVFQLKYEACLSKAIDTSQNSKLNSNRAHEQKFWSSSEFIKFSDERNHDVDNRFSLEIDFNVPFLGVNLSFLLTETGWIPN